MKIEIGLIKEFGWMLLISSLLFVCGKAKAQVLPEYSAFPKSSFGLQLGTQGIGVQGTWSFMPGFNARAGLNTFAGISVQYNGRELQFNRNSVYLMADWQPGYGNDDWWSTKLFVSAGFAKYFSNSLYRQGINTTPDYTIYMSKFRPYLGTGLGNLKLTNSLILRLDLGYYIPTTQATSTYDNKADKVGTGLRGLLPGLNAGGTIYIKF